MLNFIGRTNEGQGDGRSYSLYRPTSRISGGGGNIGSATSMHSRKKKNGERLILDSTDAWNYPNSNPNLDKYYNEEAINPNPYIMENNYMNMDRHREFNDDTIKHINKERKMNKTDFDYHHNDYPDFTHEEM